MGKGDPNKPRGKMSPYGFFVLACREEIKKKHPRATVNLSEFSKACAERWKSTTAAERGKFEDLSTADKFRYEREMKSYIRPEGEPKRKNKKDPNKPKKPPTSFFIFSSEHRAKIRAECPGLSLGDTSKKLSEKWAEQTPTDRIPFEQKAALLKEKYEKDVAAYRAKDKRDVVTAAPADMEEDEEEDAEADEEEDEEYDE